MFSLLPSTAPGSAVRRRVCCLCRKMWRQRVIPMLRGAMAELRIGDPLDYATDIGPVIDAEAREKLDAHKAQMAKQAKTILDLPLPAACAHGTFVSPAAYELESISSLKREVFGPVLHVVRFAGNRIARGLRRAERNGLWPHPWPAYAH